MPPNRRVVEVSACENGWKIVRKLFGRHSHAGVDDLEADAGIGTVGGRYHADDEPDAALLGEFDGVAQQIDQNLAEPHRIGVDRFRDRPAVFDVERELFGDGAVPASTR